MINNYSLTSEIVSIEATTELHGWPSCLRCCSSSGYNTLLSILEGTSNSPDIWNAVNGLNQQGYEGALGAATAHQTQPGSYGSLQPPHSHLVRFAAGILEDDNEANFLTPCGFDCVFVYSSGLLSTLSDACRYEPGSPTNVHFSPQQHTITQPIDQHIRELHR